MATKKKKTKTKSATKAKAKPRAKKKSTKGKASPVYVADLGGQSSPKKAKTGRSESKKDSGKAAYRFIADGYSDDKKKNFWTSLPDKLMGLVSGLVTEPVQKNAKANQDLATLRKEWIKKRVLDSGPVKALRGRRKPK